MNIPNFLTLCRVLLIPVLLIFLINGEHGKALLLFVVASVTDGLDGFIARVFKQKTLFGAYFDPVADKLLIDSAYIALAILQGLPAWLAVVVLSRDVVIVLGIAIFWLTNRPLAIKPIWSSKVTTFLQMITVCLFFDTSVAARFVFVREIFLYGTALFTLFSGFYYITIGFRSLNGNGEPLNHESH